ncbi:6077_t:CDS:2, partial [Funneliformis caledonium]
LAVDVFRNITYYIVASVISRINKISTHLEYIIELLGVIGHFLEVMIFQMGIIGTAPVDRSTTFGIKQRKVEDLEKDEIIFLEGDHKKKIKLPFLTLYEIFSSCNTSKILQIKILDTLSNVLSPDQNKHLTILVIMFRLWAIYQRAIEIGSIDPCK